MTESGWQPDPTQRHELRYHDGQQWTANVSDAGAQTTDPYTTGRQGWFKRQAATTQTLIFAGPCLLIVAVIFALAGSSGDDKTPSTESPAPTYTVGSVDERGQQRYVTVKVTTATGLREVFDAVRDRYQDEGGYFVSIDCATGGTTKAANRLATGKYAVGQEGAAATGLKDGDSEFTPNQPARCPA